MSENNKLIYDLDLHEIMGINDYVEVMRVPGGWLYMTFSNQNDVTNTCVFVSYNNEFQGDKL